MDDILSKLPITWVDDHDDPIKGIISPRSNIQTKGVHDVSVLGVGVFELELQNHVKLSTLVKSLSCE